jgi:hypothetical protein
MHQLQVLAKIGIAHAIIVVDRIDLCGRLSTSDGMRFLGRH